MDRPTPLSGKRPLCALLLSLYLPTLCPLNAQEQGPAPELAPMLAALELAAPEQTQLLHLQTAAQALKLGNWDQARLHLDASFEALGKLADAARNPKDARKLLRKDKGKCFIGQPHELALACFYRGLVHWHDGNFSAARSCFQSMNQIDGDLDAQRFHGDWVLGSWMEGLCDKLLGLEAGPRLKRAEELLAAPLPSFNSEDTLIVVEFGRGPVKRTTQSDPVQLRYEAPTPGITHALLRINGEVLRFLAMDDLQFQANTRDGLERGFVPPLPEPDRDAQRAYDELLAKLLPEAKALTQGRLSPAGLEFFPQLVKATGEEHVDQRAWPKLPRFLSANTIRLSPGIHSARIEFFDGRRFVTSQDFSLEIKENGPRIAFVSAVN